MQYKMDQGGNKEEKKKKLLTYGMEITILAHVLIGF